MSIIEMSGYNDDEIVEIINAGEPTHQTDVVSNVIYSGLSRKEAKRERSNHDKFMQWTQSLGGNKDVVSETHSFQYAQKTTEYDRRGNPIIKKQSQEQPEEQKQDPLPYGTNDPQIIRFLEAKRRANLL